MTNAGYILETSLCIRAFALRHLVYCRSRSPHGNETKMVVVLSLAVDILYISHNNQRYTEGLLHVIININRCLQLHKSSGAVSKWYCALLSRRVSAG